MFSEFLPIDKRGMYDEGHKRTLVQHAKLIQVSAG